MYLKKKARHISNKVLYRFFKVRQSTLGRVILVPFKSVFSSFQFPLYMKFYSGDIFEFLCMPYSMSEFAGFKNIYIYVYIILKIFIKSLKFHQQLGGGGGGLRMFFFTFFLNFSF